MSEALKAFEEELQSKNFKGYWQNQQGDVNREPVPSFDACFWKGKDLFAAMEKPATLSAWMSRFAASFSCGTRRSRMAHRVHWCSICNCSSPVKTLCHTATWPARSASS